MLEILQMGFIKNAIVAIIFGSVLCGIIGSYVVVNRITFLAGGVAHASFGGVGLAFFLNIPVLPTTFVFSLVASALIGILTVRDSEKIDTAVGILWSSGMAVGIILLDLTPGYKGNLMGYLFGSILGVSNGDLLFMAISTFVVILLVIVFYRNLAIMSFDREFAAVQGVPVGFFHVLVLVFIGFSLVILIRVSGLILVIALLSIPPAIASKFTKSFFSMIIFSVGINLVIGFSGLYFSYYFNVSSGASIILLLSALYSIIVLSETTYKYFRKYNENCFDKS